jgi:hypothetical protein
VIPLDGPLGGPDGGCSGCQALEVNLGNVYAMGIDPNYLYWATPSAGTFTLYQAPLAGGAPKVMAMGLQPVAHIAANASYVYLLVNANQILAFTASGGAPTSVWNDGTATAESLAVDGLHAYWTAAYNGGATGAIFSGAPGQAPTMLANGAFFPSSMAVDATNVYFGDFAGHLWLVSKGGGSPTTFFNGLANVLTVAGSTAYGVHDTHVNCNDKYVAYSVPVSGATMATALGNGYGDCVDMVGDATWLYCADSDYGLRRFAEAGGMDTVLGGMSGVAVAMDANYVYWADSSLAGGSILRIAH